MDRPVEVAGEFIVKSVGEVFEKAEGRAKDVLHGVITETTNWTFVSGVSLLGALVKSEFEHLSVWLCFKASLRWSLGGNFEARCRSPSAWCERISSRSRRWSFLM